MDTQFLNRSKKKREKIFKDRVSKSIKKLLDSLSSHDGYHLTENEQIELTISIVNRIIEKGKKNADQIIKSPNGSEMNMQDLVAYIVDHVQKNRTS